MDETQKQRLKAEEMRMFGRGKSEQDFRDGRHAAQIEDGKARGTNYVRVADVQQRHSTGTGRDGTTIKGRLH